MARSVTLGNSSRFILLASACVVVGALYFAREVLLPLALAVLLTFLLTPLVRRLESMRLGRVPAVVTVVMLALLLVLAVGWIVEQQFVALANELPNYRGQIRQKMLGLRSSSSGGVGKAVEDTGEVIRSVMTPTAPTTGPSTQPATQPATQPTTGPTTSPATGPTTTPTSADAPPPAFEAGLVPPPPPPPPLPPPAPDPTPAGPIPPLPPRPTDAPGEPLLTGITPETPLPVRLTPEPPTAVGRLGKYLAVLVDPLATFGLVIVFVLFMLIGREDLRDRMIRLAGRGHLHLTTQAIDDAAVRISRYLSSQAAINTCYGLAIAVGLWVIGATLGGPGRYFPSVLLWGLVAGLLRFVPYLGAVLGAAGPAVVAFGFFPGHGVLVATVVMFVALELIVSQLVEPLVYGSSTGMSALAVLVAAVFWTWLWGPAGLLLSTPLTAVVVVLGKHVPQLQFLGILLGDEPVLDPPVRLYQRLVAYDAEEAADMARDALAERPLLDVYDDLIVPALNLAEQDRHRGALDDDRYAFALRSLREIVDELPDLNRQLGPKREAAAAAAAATPRGATAERAGPDATANPSRPASNGSGSGNGKGNGSGNGKGKVGRRRRGRMEAAAPRAAPPRPIDPSADPAAARVAAPAAAPELPLAVPAGCTVNIVCLPARDEADELTALMFAQLLEERRYCAFAVSQTALASEMVDAVSTRAAHLVVVSAMPPAAVSHSRYLCKRLHDRYGEPLNMVVGLWAARGDVDAAKDRITCAKSVRIGRSFRDALEAVHQLVQPVVIGAAAPVGADGGGA